MSYKVKKIIKKKREKWIVETPEGHIANDHLHATREEAERHCRTLRAYFPDKVDKETDIGYNKL